jgi:uncharacterized membrane protein YdjX (TVP38/TMEM64 family)
MTQTGRDQPREPSPATPGAAAPSAAAAGSAAAPLRRYWLVTLALLAAFLIVFGVIEWRGVQVLQDPSSLLNRGGPPAAALSFALSISDVFLPIPSSVIMIANGALFGVVRGTALSLAGTLGATAVAFFIGRRSTRLLQRLVSPAEKTRADALLARWGALAIVVTRPIPLLAETTAILAGSSPLSWPRLITATVAGAFPSCLLYALTGAQTRTFASGALMFTIVLAIAGLFYFLGRPRPPK